MSYVESLFVRKIYVDDDLERFISVIKNKDRLSKFNLIFQDEKTVRPILQAIEYRSTKIFQYIIENSYYTFGELETALQMCCSAWWREGIIFLIKKQVPVDTLFTHKRTIGLTNTMNLAVHCNDIEMIKLLIKKGVQVEHEMEEVPQPLQIALDNLNEEAAGRICEEITNPSPIEEPKKIYLDVEQDDSKIFEVDITRAFWGSHVGIKISKDEDKELYFGIKWKTFSQENSQKKPTALITKTDITKDDKERYIVSFNRFSAYQIFPLKFYIKTNENNIVRFTFFAGKIKEIVQSRLENWIDRTFKTSNSKSGKEEKIDHEEEIKEKDKDEREDIHGIPVYLCNKEIEEEEQEESESESEQDSVSEQSDSESDSEMPILETVEYDSDPEDECSKNPQSENAEPDPESQIKEILVQPLLDVEDLAILENKLNKLDLKYEGFELKKKDSDTNSGFLWYPKDTIAIRPKSKQQRQQEEEEQEEKNSWGENFSEYRKEMDKKMREIAKNCKSIESQQFKDELAIKDKWRRDSEENQTRDEKITFCKHKVPRIEDDIIELQAEVKRINKKIEYEAEILKIQVARNEENNKKLETEEKNRSGQFQKFLKFFCLVVMLLIFFGRSHSNYKNLQREIEEQKITIQKLKNDQIEINKELVGSVYDVYNGFPPYRLSDILSYECEEAPKEPEPEQPKIPTQECTTYKTYSIDGKIHYQFDHAGSKCKLLKDGDKFKEGQTCVFFPKGRPDEFTPFAYNLDSSVFELARPGDCFYYKNDEKVVV